MINNEIIKLKFDNSFNGRLFATQGDTGRVFNLQVFDDYNKPVDVTGMKLRMYVANSKEVSYSEGEIVEAAEGKVKVQVYNSQLKYPGKQKAQFILTDKDGQKIGSKIFDLWIEEGLEAGPTVGRNIYVDFEKINEVLDLIRNYDKTLEEAREVDASLKVGINEGIEARNNLADCKKKALEIKEQLDTSKVDANKTLDNLKTTKTESETLKSNLTSENQKATENIKDLTNKIDTGKAASNELNTSIEDAKVNKENLDKSNTTALATKKSLEDATTTANTTKENLSNLKTQGDTLSGDLTAKITDGNKLKSNLDASISNAVTAKSNLDTSVETATSIDTTLKATNTEAKKTEALIRDLMSQLGKTEDEVKQIIAAGDLSKYVTDPKLQEVLKDYVTKIELNKSLDKKIDKTAITDDFKKQSQEKVLSQKGAYDLYAGFIEAYGEIANDFSEQYQLKADKSEIPTTLSQLTNDENFKTEAEIQTLINNSTKLKKELVTSLPSTGKEDIIYLLKNKNDTNNFYTEYMWIGGKWEIIGDTKVDLSGYAKKSDIKTKLSEMEEDSNHKVVTDSEKQSWNKKFELPQGKENQVLTKTTDGAEFKEISSSRSATFVIANYDSSENSKAGADYVIQESDCATEIINGFITKLPEYGGKIQLTEGNFNIKKDLTININKNNIIIEGYGDSTNIIDKLTKDERKLIIIYIPNEIKNCRLSDLNISHETSNTINIYGNNNYIKNVNVTNNGDYPSLAIDNDASKNILENCSVKCDDAICYSFGERTQSNTILNCSGTSSKKLSFLIRGSNYRLLNCSGTSTNDMAFYIDGSHHQFSNCSGTSTNDMAFYVKGLYHTILNCSGTSTNNTSFYVNGSQISVIACFGESKKPDKFFDVLFGSDSSKCIMLGTYCGSAQFANRGTNNILEINIK